jgi:hypothetical protein
MPPRAPVLGWLDWDNILRRSGDCGRLESHAVLHEKVRRERRFGHGRGDVSGTGGNDTGNPRGDRVGEPNYSVDPFETVIYVRATFAFARGAPACTMRIVRFWFGASDGKKWRRLAG